jgi:hypothetical protein
MEIYQCRLGQKFGGQTTKSPDHKIPVLMGVIPSVPEMPRPNKRDPSLRPPSVNLITQACEQPREGDDHYKKSTDT